MGVPLGFTMSDTIPVTWEAKACGHASQPPPGRSATGLQHPVPPTPHHRISICLWTVSPPDQELPWAGAAPAWSSQIPSTQVLGSTRANEWVRSRRTKEGVCGSPRNMPGPPGKWTGPGSPLTICTPTPTPSAVHAQPFTQVNSMEHVGKSDPRALLGLLKQDAKAKHINKKILH